MKTTNRVRSNTPKNSTNGQTPSIPSVTEQVNGISPGQASEKTLENGVQTAARFAWLTIERLAIMRVLTEVNPKCFTATLVTEFLNLYRVESDSVTVHAQLKALQLAGIVTETQGGMWIASEAGAADVAALDGVRNWVTADAAKLKMQDALQEMEWATWQAGALNTLLHEVLTKEREAQFNGTIEAGIVELSAMANKRMDAAVLGLYEARKSAAR